MSVLVRLSELGGVASYGALAAVAPRAGITTALEAGEIVRVGRGRYALPLVDESLRAAVGLDGVLSDLSACLAWGWAVKTVPDRPHVTVPVKRKVPRTRRAKVHLHRRDLFEEDKVDRRTSASLTLEQCLRVLPFDEALAVADSALRDGHESALRAAARARGPGAPRIREVARLATGLAANPFESVLRAICLQVPGLQVRPQVRVGPFRADLVDEDLRLVLEADSFAWHGNRHALRRDAERYNRMVVDGWMVLRFAWEDVMFHSQQVRETLERAVALADRRR